MSDPPDTGLAETVARLEADLEPGWQQDDDIRNLIQAWRQQRKLSAALAYEVRNLTDISECLKAERASELKAALAAANEQIKELKK